MTSMQTLIVIEIVLLAPVLGLLISGIIKRTRRLRKEDRAAGYPEDSPEANDTLE